MPVMAPSDLLNTILETSYPHMQYSRIFGGQRMKSFNLETSLTALERRSPATKRSNSVQNKPDRTAWDISGWIRVALTKQTWPSSLKRLVLSSASTRYQPNATSTWRMSQTSPQATAMASMKPCGTSLREANGLPYVGHSKSFLRRRRSSFSQRKVREWATRNHSLLGICGVYMPFIYGEGEENAFRWLRITVQNAS